MKTKEELLWILDDPKTEDRRDWRQKCQNEKWDPYEEYRPRIEFVHSLGLKCDCVGWSKLDLQDPRADEILTAIDAVCRKEGWQARGYYKRYYSDYTSEWYEIQADHLKDGTVCDPQVLKNSLGQNVVLSSLRAYRELMVAPKTGCGCRFLVPERFRDACIRHNVKDVDFCWAEDKGKYAAEQYFELLGNQLIPKVATGRSIGCFLCSDPSRASSNFLFSNVSSDSTRLEALGGSLPGLLRFFNLQDIELQNCLLRSEMPDCSIAYSCFEMEKRSSLPTFFIHKSFVDVLLKENAINDKNLRPAVVVDRVPAGYEVSPTVAMARPEDDVLVQMTAKYEKLKKTVRPVYRITEKDALTSLRTVKKERKEDFQRGLRKAELAEISETRFAPLLPYYAVANGGCLSDEYWLLSYQEAVNDTNEFFKELNVEELFNEKPDGIVFAKCPDSDRVLLCTDGKVVRFSHEGPEIRDEWDSLPSFIVDAINS